MDFSDFQFSGASLSRLVVYSRFSLHSDDEDAENLLLAHLASIQNRRLLVLIEVRTVLDELYGVGTEAGGSLINKLFINLPVFESPAQRL